MNRKRPIQSVDGIKERGAETQRPAFESNKKTNNYTKNDDQTITQRDPFVSHKEDNIAPSRRSFRLAPAVIQRRRQASFNIISVALLLFAGAYGLQAYNLNQDLKRELAVLGADSGETTAGQPRISQIAENDEPEEEEPSEQAVAEYRVAPNAPRYLKIPKLGIKARIVSVGETPEGAVDVPANIHDVGWYMGSKNINSENGAGFLVGHVSGYTNTGVFYELSKLSSGDAIIVEKGNGEEISFNVFERNDYSVDNVDMRRALRQSSRHSDRLNINLMTCSGDFNAEADTYESRSMISAVASL
jgi:sortase A